MWNKTDHNNHPPNVLQLISELVRLQWHNRVFSFAVYGSLLTVRIILHD
jgi:hypothetical protein